MREFEITLTVKVKARNADSARKLAALYKEAVSRLVLRARREPTYPTRVMSVKAKTPKAKGPRRKGKKRAR